MDISRRDIVKYPLLVLSYPVVALLAYGKGLDVGGKREEEDWREKLERARSPSFGDDEVREIEREISLDPGGYETVELSLKKETHFSGGFVADDHLDLLMMEPSDYREYENDGDPQYMVYFSELNTSETILDQTVTDGDYYIVLDHTTKGKATPNQPTEAVLHLTLRQT